MSKLKKIGVISTLVAMSAGITIPSTNASIETNLLHDVKNSVFYSAIENVVTNGIFTVYKDGSFKADEILTREKLAKFIYLYLQKKEGLFKNETNLSPYADVRSDNHYAKYVTGLYQAGLMTGYQDGTFGYKKNLTRAELLTILTRVRIMIDSKAPAITDAYIDTINHSFTDVPKTHGLYKYVQYSVGQNFIAANTTFSPDNVIRKDEAAALINRILLEKYLSENPETNVSKESPFYKGDKLTFANNDNSATLELEDNNKLYLTLDRKAELNGKLVYINKNDILLQVNNETMDNIVSRVTLAYKGSNELIYGIELNKEIEGNIKFILNSENALIASMMETNIEDYRFDDFEDNNTNVENNNTNIEDNNTNIEDNNTNVEDNNTNVEDNNTNVEDNNTNVSGEGLSIENIEFNTYDSLPSTQAIPFMQIKISNSNKEDAKITSIDFEKLGLGDKNMLEKFVIVDENNIILTNNRNFISDGSLNLRFDNTLVIKSGENKTLTIKGNVKKNSNIAGQTYGLKIKNAESFIGENLVLDNVTFPIESKQYSIVESEVGEIIIRKGDSVSESNVGDENVLLTSFFIDNTNTSSLYLRNIGLYQGGSINEKDLDQIKLVNVTDGEVLVSDEVILGKNKINFIIPEAVKIKQGETKLFEVRANINDGKNENIKLYIENAQDVSIYKEYGESMKFDARVNFSAFDQDVADHNVIDILGGKITISAGNDTNSDVSKSGSSVKLGKFNITSNNEEIEVKNITLEMLGKNDSNTPITDLASYQANFDDWASKINSLRLVDADTGDIISDIINPTNSSNKITFDINNVFIGNNDTKVKRIAIVGNVSSTAGTNDEYYFKVLTNIGTNGFLATTTIDENDIESKNLSPSVSITLDKRTIKDAILTVQTSSENYKDILIKGSNQIETVSFLLKAPSVSTVKVKTLKLKVIDPNFGEAGANIATVANSFQNITLYKGEEVWASAEDIVEVDAGNGYVTFTDINKTLEKNEELILTIKVDVTNNANPNDEFLFQIESSSDVTGTDKNSVNVTVTDGDSYWSNPIQEYFKNTIQEQGKITLAASSDTPKSNLISTNSEDNYFSVYKAELSVENENTEISKISFKYGPTTNNEGRENLEDGILLIDGKKVGTAKSFSTNGITFDFSNDDRQTISELTVGKGKVITLELQVKSKTNEEDIKRGGIVVFELDNSTDALEFYGVNSQKKLIYTESNSVSLSGSGNTFKYYYSIPKFEKYDGNYTDVIPAEGQILYVAKVKAEGSYRLFLESLAIKKSGQATITGLKAYVNSTGVSTSLEDLVTAEEDYLSFDKGTSLKKLSLIKNSNVGELINAGEYVYVTIVGDLNNSFKGNSLSLSIEPSTTNGEFVWHDNLSSNDNLASDNKYIKDLPDTKSWVNTQNPITDTTNPVISTVKYQDTNINGIIDTVKIVITDANSTNIYGSNAQSFIFKNGADLFRANALSISGKTITLTNFSKYNSVNKTWDQLANGDLSTNIGNNFTMYYTAEGDAIRDASGNLLQAITSNNAISVTDNVAPTLMSVVISNEVGSNGIFDLNGTESISFVFSEAVKNDISLNDLQAGLELDDNGNGIFDGDLTTIMNDDLLTDATANIVRTTTNVANDTITVTADGTNTTSSSKITASSVFRITNSQVVITDVEGNNAISGNVTVE